MDTDEGLLIALVAVLFALSVALVLPYLQFLLAAVVLAFVLRPLQVELEPHLGRSASAGLLLVLSLVALILPFFLVTVFVASDVMAFVSGLEEQDLNFGMIERPIQNYTGVEVDVGSAVRSSLSGFGSFDSALSVFGTLTHVLIGLGLLLFLLFFFVRDADRFVEWLQAMSPLPATVTDELIDRTVSITNAVLAGHVLVAIVQGVLAGVGLAVFGVPNFVFWTLVMIILGLIPIIGSFAIWAPACVYLFVMGETVSAVALFVYGSTVVAISDDYLRPVIVDRYAHVSPSVIIIGVLGGLSVLGFMGLFVGPIIVAALKESIEVYDAHYGYPTRELER
ncbi:AI-2E family transporter [Natronomonas salina]|uniref:AI-2E family transporter n=1 Tax=Natronomonas salina TaxID=1710540 RepID=UPI0015B5BDE9|nr:AI-2E family transporter [Natronomonas salina]QLD88363.1 AI-2E family transporter [Natronomonas salina]